MLNFELKGKWGDSSLILGFTPIPTTLIYAQKELGLSSIEMNILLNLLTHWWKKEEFPYPSQAGIAHRIGVSTRTVQRTLAGLETKGFIIRNKTSRDNNKYKGRSIYDLSPLVKILEEKTPELDIVKKQKKLKKVSNPI